MGCGCLIMLAAMASPRLALAIAWLFTDEVDQAFDALWIPAVGFVFLPWTTLAYAVVANPLGDVGSVGWLLVAVGLLADAGSWGATSRQDYRRA